MVVKLSSLKNLLLNNAINTTVSSLNRFIWIMGVSTALSLRSQLRSSASRKKAFWRIVKRTSILILLGLLLNSRNVDKDTYLRIPGVLQRIGVTYFIVASIELIFAKPQRNEQVYIKNIYIKH